jgi:hypothetical protein
VADLRGALDPMIESKKKIERRKENRRRRRNGEKKLPPHILVKMFQVAESLTP